jgi:allophanate hydrolase subunit 1
MEQPGNQLNIEISEEVAEGSYANLAIITHSNAEFVIDFVNVMPGTPKSKFIVESAHCCAVPRRSSNRTCVDPGEELHAIYIE